MEENRYHLVTVFLLSLSFKTLTLKNKIMSNTITAKFNVASITEYGNGGGKKVCMQPVINGSEENKEWSKYTPSGSIEIHVTNPDANFEFGEYLVNFTKAD